MYIEPEIKSSITSHAGRLGGQITGIKTMLNQNRDALDILILVLAVQSSFTSLSSALDSAFRMHINIILHTPLPHNLQTPAYLQLIESFKVTLPSSSLQQILKIMQAIKAQKIN